MGKLPLTLSKTKDIFLPFNEDIKASFSYGEPLTFLVNPVENLSPTRRDRFFLRVRSTFDTKNVCIIVAAYEKRYNLLC